MSGHSKWSSIKHKKGKEDAKRGKIFSKLIKEITIAARLGGGDPTGNPRLKVAISTAKANNMPAENIERAIKKGTGELEGESYEEMVYEGYGPGGTAVMVDIMTDNKKRTVSELRYIFTKNNGNLSESGSVSWIFEKKGIIVCDKNSVDEDILVEIALEAGAEDIKEQEKEFEIISSVEDFETVKEGIITNNIPYTFAEITMISKTAVQLEGKEAQQMLKLLEMLEDSNDVQKVYANFDISDEIMEQMI
ncbi:MAG: YebC/PmpR family DNA-binding transcriptional regulator [Thermodesulfobacteriota bacterium]|nr:YebC/PmpR family DNA-binding transcriptional regulator [Thermodesulfobacteriota bacterium]